MFNNTYRSIFSIFVPVGLLFILFSQWDSADLIESETKQKGAHLFGHITDSTDFQPLHKSNIDWVTLVPWGFQKDYDSPIMQHHHGDSLRILRRDSSLLNRIKLVHEAGFKVFFKPHIWIDSPTDGKWRSDIYPTSDENWEAWKISYRDFIMRYAKLAEKANAEMFCIGTELTLLSIKKPDYWSALIQEVRTIYSGKITYAANWYQEFEEITFWEELDYIGIQAYFPLVNNENPSLEQISEGWNQHLPSIEAVHKKYNRKVLFTEMGYKSTADSAIKPWEWLDYDAQSDYSHSPETQANCYQAFFDTVWIKKWFAGVHIWQLRSDFKENKRETKLDFTPQEKFAEEVITRGFE